MYQKILVPLDGSHLAEHALPYAKKLAQNDAELILLQVIRLPLPVISPEIGMGMPVIDMDDLSKESLSYLNGIVAQLDQEGLHAKAEIVEGENVADAIAAFAKTHGIDLIVQSTHGRGGLSRLVFGSVAEAVLRQTPCPIMFIRVHETS